MNHPPRFKCSVCGEDLTFCSVYRIPRVSTKPKGFPYRWKKLKPTCDNDRCENLAIEKAIYAKNEYFELLDKCDSLGLSGKEFRKDLLFGRRRSL